jgi:hypothetical protein
MLLFALFVCLVFLWLFWRALLAFAERISVMETGRWQGPVSSGRRPSRDCQAE